MQEPILQPIGGQSVVEQATYAIINAVTAGKFKAGEKLPSEFELMQEMKIGRNSLREAMKILSNMGIIEIKRGDGTYVCTEMRPVVLDQIVYSIIFDLSTNAELLELRQVLDEATVRLAMQKLTPAHDEKLQQDIHAMRAQIAECNFEAASQCDYAFHTHLIEACGNPFFERILKGVYALFSQSISRNVQLETANSAAPTYHQRILDCMRGHRVEEVTRVVADSLITWRENIRK